MRSFIAHTVAVSAAMGLALSFVAAPVAAKGKTIQTEAKFISYDAEKKVMEVKVLKPGKKPKNKALRLKRGKSAAFNIKPDGSVLTRTSVTNEGRRIDITDIPEDKTLTIYWLPDDSNEDQRFARKIDMTLTDEEAEARDAERLEKARAEGKVEDDD